MNGRLRIEARDILETEHIIGFRADMEVHQITECALGHIFARMLVDGAEKTKRPEEVYKAFFITFAKIVNPDHTEFMNEE